MLQSHVPCAIPEKGIEEAAQSAMSLDHIYGFGWLIYDGSRRIPRLILCIELPNSQSYLFSVELCGCGWREEADGDDWKIPETFFS
jgi:hypothetical protein